MDRLYQRVKQSFDSQNFLTLLGASLDRVEKRDVGILLHPPAGHCGPEYESADQIIDGRVLSE